MTFARDVAGLRRRATDSGMTKDPRCPWCLHLVPVAKWDQHRAAHLVEIDARPEPPELE